jgi:hypothetical protein
MRRLGQLTGLGLIAIGLFLAFKTLMPVFKFEMGSPSYRLESLWQKDLADLQQAGHLPKEWTDVAEIQLNPTTDDARAWLKQIHTPIAVNANGKHKLDILIFSWEDGGHRGAVIMHHLLELPSENMIYEISRTYDITKSPISDLISK